MSNGLLAALMQVQSSPPSASDLAQQVISTADTDGDGELTADEISKALSDGGQSPDVTKAFASLDTNGDGKLSADELTSGVSAMQQRRAEGGGHHHHHGMGGANGMADALMSALDTDGDGTASADELSTALGSNGGTDASSILKALDANGDSQLSSQEIADAFLKALQGDQASSTTAQTA